MARREAALRRLTALLIATALAVLCVPPTAAESERDRELAELRARIGKLNDSIRKDTSRRDKAVAELRDTERRIETQRKKLRAIRDDRREAEKQLAQLRVEQSEREQDLATGKEALAAELRTAYMNGGREQLRMLLNQEDPAVAGRMSVYYRYYSERRADMLRVVAEKLAALREVSSRVAAKVAELARLEDARKQELAELASARDARSALIADIESRLRQSDSAVSRLRDEEAQLLELIRELETLLQDFPVGARDAFSVLKGQLAWPVRGRLLADFGQPRAGRQVKWNGVLVGADRGDAVRAIARGRVAFSDWLPGLGLLVVLEHSEGYISLYGHNETLTREAGEWLEAGDVLATVGDSGGQPQAALYFEIRRGKTPVNPHGWFRGAVGAR